MSVQVAPVDWVAGGGGGGGGREASALSHRIHCIEMAVEKGQENLSDEESCFLSLSLSSAS